MWPSKQSHPKMTIKEKLDAANTMLTMTALCVGGLWTYNMYRERAAYAHANIEHHVSHIKLSDNVNILRVGVEITNVGKIQLTSSKSLIAIQQITPPNECNPNSCVINEIEEALQSENRTANKFNWPPISTRQEVRNRISGIEPGETDKYDFKFAIPARIGIVRVYTYFQNDTRVSEEHKDVGWSTSSYYVIHNLEGAENVTKNSLSHRLNVRGNAASTP
jgi:hypothetical protein